MKIQSIITACIDTGIQNGSLQMREGEGSWEAHTRLVGLGAEEVDHIWLWRLNSHHGLYWSLRSTLTRYAYGWDALGAVNLCPVLPARLTPWTRALPMPPAAPWARLLVVTTRSPLSSMLPLNPVTTPLRTRFLASSLAPPQARRRPHLCTWQRVHRPGHIDLLTARPAGQPRLHPFQARGQT